MHNFPPGAPAICIAIVELDVPLWWTGQRRPKDIYMLPCLTRLYLHPSLLLQERTRHAVVVLPPPIVKFGDDMHIGLCDKIYTREGDMKGTLLYSITRSAFLARPNLSGRQRSG